ncbi:MAG: Nif3-like dinuclear metal center hexameric protein [Fusobacteriaceae bacterium]
MKLQKITGFLEGKYPKRNAEDWDNVGLLVGDKDAEIKKILLVLDCDLKAIEMAKECGANLIIAHHPMIFSPIKNVDYSTVMGQKLKELIKNDINLYAMHTNIDSSARGLNEYIVKKLGVETAKILAVNANNSEIGIGRYFKLETKKKLSEYIDFVKEKLEIETAIIYRSQDVEFVEKVAVVNGSGANFWKKAKFYGVDLLITADVKYHDAEDANENGITLLDLNHYESEKFFMELLKENLKELNNELETKIFNKKRTFEIV